MSAAEILISLLMALQVLSRKDLMTLSRYYGAFRKYQKRLEEEFGLVDLGGNDGLKSEKLDQMLQNIIISGSGYSGVYDLAEVSRAHASFLVGLLKDDRKRSDSNILSTAG